MQRKVKQLPAQASRFDLAVLGITGFALLCWVVVPTQAVTGAALVLAGGANLVRLARWRGEKTLAEPLVWILHTGYGWLGVALSIMGGAALWPSVVPTTAGIHALTVGAIGVMTLAMMTRAILGHTGRTRHAGWGTLAIYLLANLAACLRIAAAFLPANQALLLGLSASAWSLAFGGFVIVYGPMLVGGRGGLVAPTAAAASPGP
jgi:uncharacterized protein involved in response to NO